MVLEVIGSEEKPLRWEEFEGDVEVFLSEVREKRVLRDQDPEYFFITDDPIFRGQSNSRWKLEDTLERVFLNQIKEDDIYKYDIYDYYENITHISFKLSSLSDVNISEQDIHKAFKNLKGRSSSLPNLDILYYLRHHGFPTPILDWSRSFYVAAYFAFINAKINENVAIYSFHYFDGEPFQHTADSPILIELPPYAKTHHRHFRQQSAYTYASISRLNENSSSLEDRRINYFVSHEFAIAHDNQDSRARKYIIKGSERDKVLRKLNMMNINHYTLFGTEDSLIKALATEEFILRD